MTTTSQTQIQSSTNAFSNGAVGVPSGSAGAGVGAATEASIGDTDANLLMDNEGGSSRAGPTCPSSNAVNKNSFTNSTSGIMANNAMNPNTMNNNGNVPREKRKKIKKLSNSNYGKEHLDAWLETCLKDASNAQLSSSSEFLDFNPAANKSIFPQPPAIISTQLSQPQQQQHQHQHQHHHQQQQPSSSNNLPHFSHSQMQQDAMLQQQQQQQLQTMRGRNQQSNNGYNTPFNLGLQRNMPNYMKPPNSHYNRYSMMFPPAGTGYYQQNDGSQDFASLPPIVNLMGGLGSSDHDNNSTDVLDGSGSNPNISRGFRFSDPCLLNPSDNDSKVSGQNTPDRRHNVPSEMESNKFFVTLMEQINMLHETTTKICRNLHETRVDIEALKHAPTWGGMRHRRDSLSGLSTHSQPLAFGGFGTQSPAPTYHSGAYTPGCVSDVVREVKEAARVREDALLNRVKAMVEERQWSMNECNLRIMRDIEELKTQVQHLRLERKESNKRLNHLEAENKYMRQLLASIYNNRHAPDIIYENETLRPRKTLPQQTRRAQSFNLHYGTMQSSQSVDEEPDEALQIIETPSTSSTADVAAPTKVTPRTTTTDKQQRHSISSIESCSGVVGGGGGGVGGVDAAPQPLSTSSTTGHVTFSPLTTVNSSAPAPIQSPPNFALVSPPAALIESTRKKPNPTQNVDSKPAQDYSTALANSPQSQKMQRDLEQAVAARKEADQRIIALEKLVQNLSAAAQPAESPTANNITNGLSGVGVGLGVSNLGGSATNLKWNNLASTTSATANQAHTTSSTPTTTVFNIKTPQSSLANTISMVYTPSKLSVAGPITDL